MLISLTVGKVDAGVAVLLTEDKRLIEFPSILLPPSISSGSIVDITVSRNHASEDAAQDSFDRLQSSIFSKYGQTSPSAPVLRCRNATQTSVVLEWDPIQLATADIRSLSLYRNGAKAGSIPRPLAVTSTKISGLAIDTEYTFHLVLRTSAGVYSSQKLVVRTHKMTDLSGITVTPGVLPAQLRYSLAGAVERVGGKMVDNVRIDTTHFVCTEGRGREWERAVEMNIPVVRPEWIEGCEREGRIVGVRGYYLNADPRLRQVGQGVNVGNQGQSRRTESQANIPRMPPASTSAEGSSAKLDTAVPSTAGTESSMTSPHSAGNGQRSARSTVNVEPPTPPAKDMRHSRSDSTPGSARGVPPEVSPSPSARSAAEQSTEGGEESEETSEEEHEESSKQHDARSQPGTRSLVQSPFDAEHRDKGLPDRTSGGEKQLKREPSDVGSFSEVQL